MNDQANPEPEQDERKDHASRTRIDDLAEGYLTWGRRSLMILSAIAVIQVLTAIAAVYLWDQNQQRVSENKALITNLKTNIKAAELRRCEDINERHDKGVKALDAVLTAAVKKGDLPQSAVSESRKQNLILIDAIVTKRDCQTEVQKLGLG